MDKVKDIFIYIVLAVLAIIVLFVMFNIVSGVMHVFAVDDIPEELPPMTSDFFTTSYGDFDDLFDVIEQEDNFENMLEYGGFEYDFELRELKGYPPITCTDIDDKYSHHWDDQITSTQYSQLVDGKHHASWVIFDENGDIEWTSIDNVIGGSALYEELVEEYNEGNLASPPSWSGFSGSMYSASIHDVNTSPNRVGQGMFGNTDSGYQLRNTNLGSWYCLNDRYLLGANDYETYRPLHTSNDFFSAMTLGNFFRALEAPYSENSRNEKVYFMYMLDYDYYVMGHYDRVNEEFKFYYDDFTFFDINESESFPVIDLPDAYHKTSVLTSALNEYIFPDYVEPSEPEGDIDLLSENLYVSDNLNLKNENWDYDLDYESNLNYFYLSRNNYDIDILNNEHQIYIQTSDKIDITNYENVMIDLMLEMDYDYQEQQLTEFQNSVDVKMFLATDPVSDTSDIDYSASVDFNGVFSSGSFHFTSVPDDEYYIGYKIVIEKDTVLPELFLDQAVSDYYIHLNDFILIEQDSVEPVYEPEDFDFEIEYYLSEKDVESGQLPTNIKTTFMRIDETTVFENLWYSLPFTGQDDEWDAWYVSSDIDYNDTGTIIVSGSVPGGLPDAFYRVTSSFHRGSTRIMNEIGLNAEIEIENNTVKSEIFQQQSKPFDPDYDQLEVGTDSKYDDVNFWQNPVEFIFKILSRLFLPRTETVEQFFNIRNYLSEVFPFKYLVQILDVVSLNKMSEYIPEDPEPFDVSFEVKGQELTLLNTNDHIVNNPIYDQAENINFSFIRGLMGFPIYLLTLISLINMTYVLMNGMSGGMSKGGD